MRKTEYVLVAAFALSLATWSSAGETAEAVRPPARDQSNGAFRGCMCGLFR